MSQPLQGSECAEAEDAGRRALDPHLVFDALDLGAVALAQGAIGGEFVLGHQEDADSLGSGRSAGGAGEDEVDDVLCEVVIARGDEDLFSFQQVDAVLAGGCGFGAVVTDAGASTRFGQAHRAGPFSSEQLADHGLLGPLGAVLDQQVGGGLGQTRVHREGHRRAGEHFVGDGVDGVGKAHATELWRGREREPAALCQGIPGLFVTLGRGDIAICVQGAALQVPRAIDRAHDLGGQLAGLLDHGGVHALVEVREAREGGERRVDVELLEQHEREVAEVGGVVGGTHGEPRRRAAGEGQGDKAVAPDLQSGS